MSVVRFFIFDNDCIQGSFSDGTTVTIYNDEYFVSSPEIDKSEQNSNSLLKTISESKLIGNKTHESMYAIKSKIATPPLIFQRNLLIFTRENIRKYIIQVLEYLNQHIDCPYLLDSLLSSDENTFWTNTKIHNVSWNIQDCKRIWKNGLDAGIQIKSKEKNTSINLSPNGKLLKIIYPALVHQSEEILEKHGVQTEIKYHMHGKYQYIWQEQYFSVHSFPSRWTIPVAMLLIAYANLFPCNHTQLPLIPTEDGIISQEIVYTTELPQTKEVLLETKKAINIQNNSQITNIESNKSKVSTNKSQFEKLYEREDLKSERYTSSLYHYPIQISRSIDNSDPQITFNRTAKTFESNITIEFTPFCTYKYLGEQIVEILHHDDQNLIDIFPDQIIHYSFNMKDSFPSEKCYTSNHIPEFVYYFERQDLSLTNDRQFISKKFNLRSFVSNGEKFGSISFAQEKHLKILMQTKTKFNQINNQNIISQNEENFRGSVLDPSIISTEITEEANLENVGNFILYRDERVKGRFADRTILTITPQQICTIIDRLGNMAKFTQSTIPNQYIDYVNHCLEFKRWALLTDIERQVEIRNLEEEEELIREGTFLREIVGDTIQFYGDDSFNPI